ncbi:MAG TPA: MBL fold metallo-hydrolase [Eubacteriales bacterium]|nr:MBL fold metallo-hydrolase [Eubacteriales bacterium]
MLFSPLCSGSSGNASYLEAGGVRLLIDAGVSAKKMEALLSMIDVSARSIDAILVTHEHSDHVTGVGVLSRRYDLPVYADTECWEHMPASVGAIAVKNRRVFVPDHDFCLGPLCIYPFSTPHDSAHPVGYTFRHEGKKLSIMTDVGHVSGAMLDAVADSNLLLLEANHDVDMLKAGSYPYPLKMRILSPRGHLCNEDAGLVLQKLYSRGVKNAILGHLSQENNTPELALVTVQSVLENAGLLESMFVTVADRFEPCGVFEI